LLLGKLVAIRACRRDRAKVLSVQPSTGGGPVGWVSKRQLNR